MQIIFICFCKFYFFSIKEKRNSADFHALLLLYTISQHPFREIMSKTHSTIISLIILRVSKLRRFRIDRFCVRDSHSRVDKVVKPRRRVAVEGPFNLKAPSITMSSTLASRFGIIDVEAHREIAEHKP